MKTESEDKEMICDNCGNEVADGMKFCGYCGTKVGTVKADNVLPKEATADPQNPRQHVTFPATFEELFGDVPMFQNDNVLKTIDVVTWYKGEVKVAYGDATGKLSIYRNRIELKRITGKKKVTFYGIATKISTENVKNAAPVIFQMNQIAWVRESKYAGIWKSMILEMKNGEKHTFVVGNKETQECIDLIRANIR